MLSCFWQHYLAVIINPILRTEEVGSSPILTTWFSWEVFLVFHCDAHKILSVLEILKTFIITNRNVWFHKREFSFVSIIPSLSNFTFSFICSISLVFLPREFLPVPSLTFSSFAPVKPSHTGVYATVTAHHNTESICAMLYPDFLDDVNVSTLFFPS